MYSNNNNLLHQTGHFMAQSTHMQHPNLGVDYGQGYLNDAGGVFNPVAPGVTSQYQMQNSSQTLHKFIKTDGNEAESILPTIGEKRSLSPTSSVEAHDSDSSAEPMRKKAKSGGIDFRRKSGKGGRHQDEIRTIYKYENGQWLCPKCNRVVSPRAMRMKAHFEKCSMGSSSTDRKSDTKSGNSLSSSSVKKSLEPSVDDTADETERVDGRLTSPGKKKKIITMKTIEGAGRQKSEVWQYYEEREEGQFYCKRCGKRVSSKAHRLSQHLETGCVDTPKSNVTELRKVGVTANFSKSSAIDDFRQHFDYRNGEWHCKRCGKIVSYSREKMRKHVDVWCVVSGTMAGAVAVAVSTSSVSSKSSYVRSDVGLINLQLGKFIYSSNLPFEVVEDPEFATFVKMLRANHRLPSPADLGNHILSDVESDIQTEMERDLCDKSITLIQAGWSRFPDVSIMSTSECYTIIHALHNGKSSYFLNAVQLSQDHLTPEHCLELINKAIASASSLYSCNVVGVLTDHCKTYLKLRNHVQQVRSELHVYGSFLNLLNSLGDEIVDSELILAVGKVQKFFTSSNLVDIFEFEGDFSVILAHDEKWISQSVALKSFVANHPMYRQTLDTFQLEVDQNIRDVLEKQDFLTRAQELICVLDPLTQAFSELQNDNATIADAVNCWLTLMNDPQISNTHKEKIQLAFNEGVTPMAIAAYLLHPVYRGQNMLSELQEIGRVWLLERNPMFVVGQAALERADTTYFPSSFLNSIVAKQMAPAVWWENAGKWPAIPEGLMNLAISLMVLPASTSTVDQCSNTIGNIMSTHKKKLGLDKALKLCNAYFSLRRK